MKIHTTDGAFEAIETASYCLRAIDARSLRLSVRGRALADLRVVSGVSTGDGGPDVSTNLQGPEVREEDGCVLLTWRSSSTCWNRKTYTFECGAEQFVYRVGVEGDGLIDAVEFFEGLQDDPGPASLYRFSRFMSSEVTLLDRRHYRSCEYACIDALSGPTHDTPREPEDNNHWLFCPPPLAFVWSLAEGPWLGVGVAPDPGEYNFTRFQYWPLHNCFKLRLTYDGMTRIRGQWASPRMVFAPARDDYDGVRGCVDYLYGQSLATRPARQQPEWWSRPMFCGWGQQNIFAAHRGGPGASYARQDAYDSILALLEERSLHPGTITIDDKWQKEYATLEPDLAKWPDLRGWIDARHAAGQKVLLWVGCWNRDGLPDEECIRRADNGQPVCADPSNPAYQARLAESVRRMLSPDAGCLNADGLKVDWTNGQPFGPGYVTAGSVWGIELLKTLHSTIYSAAKSAKPDSLIITHAANPYFADVTDMLRLNDISAVQRDVCELMLHRQKLAVIACPDWLIDCDNSSAPTHDEWFEYMKLQPELGVPSVYFLTHVDGTGEPIPLSDWDELPQVWRRPLG